MRALIPSAAAGRKKATTNLWNQAMGWVDDAADSRRNLTAARKKPAARTRARNRLWDTALASFPRPPEQVLDEVLDDRSVELIADVLAVPGGDDEVRVAEHGEMAGDRRPGGREGVGDLPRGARPLLEE